MDAVNEDELVLVVLLLVPPFLFGFVVGRWWTVVLSAGGYIPYMVAKVFLPDRGPSDETAWLIWAIVVMVWLGFPACTAALGVLTHRALRRALRWVKRILRQRSA